MELRKLIKDKRGLGIGDIYPIVLTIAVVAILITIIMLVFNEWQGITNKLEGETINDTLNTVDEFGEYVDNATVCGFDDWVITKVTNESTGETVTAGNYSYDEDTGEIWYADVEAGQFNNTNWNISYTFVYGGEDCEAMRTISTDYVDFVKWIGIILLVVAAAIILGVVISSFASRERV